LINSFYNTKEVKKADAVKFKEPSETFTKTITIAHQDSQSYFNRAAGDIQGTRSVLICS